MGADSLLVIAIIARALPKSCQRQYRAAPRFPAPLRPPRTANHAGERQVLPVPQFRYADLNRG
jgi:hypothetical protein